ncbi:MAG: hypothetical protein WCV55_02710 [Candidatus Paceibacterota bacterium]
MKNLDYYSPVEDKEKNSDSNTETDLENENLPSQHTHSDLIEFSKRYSLSGRQKIADEIRELRFQYFKKEKGNPDRQDLITEQEKTTEALQKEKEQIEAEIKEGEIESEKKKAFLWSRISSLFHKNEIEQELGISPEKKKLEDLKKDIAERLKIIGETENVILDISSLEEAKDKLKKFYDEQSDLKTTFEGEKEIRDVETLSRENGYIFLHGVPTKHRANRNTSMNNPTFNTEALSTEDKLSLLMGLEPTISASVIKEGQDDVETFYTFGVILAGGTVLSAYSEDAGTLAEGLYSRSSKYDKETKQIQRTSIQSNISKHLDKSINTPAQERMYGSYNEIVVEKPKVAGLYINISQFNPNFERIDISELQKYAKEFNLPVYALKDGKLYPFDVDNKIEIGEDGKKRQKENSFEPEGEQLSIDDVVDKQRDIFGEEKIKLATSVIEKRPFKIDDDGEGSLYLAYKIGSRDIYPPLGKDGYKNLRSQLHFHQMRIKAGIEEDPPITPELLLKKVEARLQEVKDNIESASSKKQEIFGKTILKNNLMSLYGFALDAEENEDTVIFESVKNLINKFGSFDEFVSFIEKRVDEKGNFKVLNEDVPLEIRKRMSNLESTN